jgi:hypothetical protein
MTGTVHPIVVLADKDGTAHDVRAGPSATALVEINPTLDTSAYAAGDVLFDTIALTDICFANDEVCALDQLTILDKDNQTAYSIALLFLKSNTSIGTIGNTASISDANAENITASILFGTGSVINVGNSKFQSQKAAVNDLKLQPASGTRTVYVAGIVFSGTPTHTANGLHLKFRSKRI